MSGLRHYARDVAPLLAYGDARLAPPEPDELLALVRAHLARADAPVPIAARWIYARWKPATSLTAGFELDYADGEQRWVSWKRYEDGKASALASRRERDVAEEVADPRLAEHVVLPSGDAHLWAPPFDRELPGLERACDLRRTKRWFLEQELFLGRRVRSSSSRAELVRYKPERRAVLRLDLRLRPLDGGPKTAAVLGARALPPHEAARVAAARRAWQDGPCGTLAPRLLGYEERTGLLYEEWLDVEAAAHDAFEQAAAAGAVLARLHAERAPSVAPAGEHRLSTAAALLRTQPELSELTGTLAPGRQRPSGEAVWTHGDFHPDQLARSRGDGALYLLDLDRLGPGRLLDDLVSWIADHLVERPGVDLGAAAGPLLDGYAAEGGRVPEHDELAAAVAEALIHRAASALRRLESGAVVKAGRLLERARAAAPGGWVFAC